MDEVIVYEDKYKKILRTCLKYIVDVHISDFGYEDEKSYLFYTEENMIKFLNGELVKTENYSCGVLLSYNATEINSYVKGEYETRWKYRSNSK